MKASDIRELSPLEIRERLSELTQSLFNLRFQKATDQLENPMALRHGRKDIARLATILREKELVAGQK